ncbi:MAG: NAD-dependent epimerase/dehydratase family protein, partial [Zymomonas sp.]
MSTAYQDALLQLRRQPKIWLITGVAGFIGSHLLETLLREGQTVRGIDNFETGSERNLEEVRLAVGDAAWSRFSFETADIRDLAACDKACEGVDFVLHEAALGSVPLSIEDPLKTHAVNVTGFVNVLDAARRKGVGKVVFAASSATYGDAENVPAIEDQIGRQLSPYGLSKYANELYAEVFARVYGSRFVGLRYFNVFGPRQDPKGAYAAVIPRWIETMLRGERVFVNGDGGSTRDFCYVLNVVQANILAATAAPERDNQIFNVAAGASTDLLALHDMISKQLAEHGVSPVGPPIHRAPLPGEVRHSQGDITRIQQALGYRAEDTV